MNSEGLIKIEENCKKWYVSEQKKLGKSQKYEPKKVYKIVHNFFFDHDRKKIFLSAKSCKFCARHKYNLTPRKTLGYEI
jgi:hypothetical protein